MYNEYFGLRDSPFSIAPNPQFLYMSERHREALAHLLYGIKSDGGFILLTGEVGTGKTTVSRCLLEQIPEDVATAFILNPKLTAEELLATICDDLQISYPKDASIKVLTDRLNHFLLSSHEQGRRTVVIIDEAQNLSIDVLEQLRLLTNLETNKRKLLQIILLGQPELLELLSRKELRQLSQRVTARFHLSALNREEVSHYIEHRLEVAGARGTLFPSTTVRRIFELSGGIPRLINLICDRALLGAYSQNRVQVDRHIIDRAAKEIFGTSTMPARATRWMFAAGFAAVVCTGFAWFAYTSYAPPKIDTASLPADSLAPAQSNSTSTPAPPTVTTPPAEDVTPTVESAALATTSVMPVTLPRLDPLIQVEGDASLDDALGTLFALWGVPSSTAGEDACAVAPGLGLQCLAILGSLRDLEHLNRPAAIKLTIAGLPHYVAITHVDAGTLTVSTLNAEYHLSARDVIRSWDGEFTILWRPPPDFRTTRPGDQGKDIDELRQQLAVIDGSDDFPSEGGGFDAVLEQRVKQFQIAVGLKPDGLVGAQTWIHLNSASGASGPRLSSPPGAS